jgi:hypothetical protein
MLWLVVDRGLRRDDVVFVPAIRVPRAGRWHGLGARPSSSLRSCLFPRGKARSASFHAVPRPSRVLIVMPAKAGTHGKPKQA